MKKFSLFMSLVLAFALLVMVIPVHAKDGIGGWNEYKGRSYAWEELDELRETLKADGYIQLTEENDYMGLTKDPDYKRYTSLPADDIEGYVNKRDLETYQNASEKDKDQARRALWLNSVEIHSYGYRPVEIQPKPTGTLFITLFVADEYKDHDIVVLLKDQDYEPLSITVHPYNDYKYIGNVPIGHYTLSSLLLDGNLYTAIPAYTRDVFGTQGADVFEMSATYINIGAGVDLSEIAGITDITNREIEVAATPTPTPIPEKKTDAEIITEAPATETPVEVPVPKKQHKVLAVLLPIMMLLSAVLLGYCIYRYIKRRGENEEF